LTKFNPPVEEWPKASKRDNDRGYDFNKKFLKRIEGFCSELGLSTYDIQMVLKGALIAWNERNDH